jgi:hypothetical protein
MKFSTFKFNGIKYYLRKAEKCYQKCGSMPVAQVSRTEISAVLAM